jgi:protoheme IX farnesyltransferase
MENSASEAVAIDGALCRLRNSLAAYLLLTKPKILLLVTLTGFTAMVLEGSLLADSLAFAAVLSGIILTGAAANALNQYWDRDIDDLMTRTRGRRPIPDGKISPKNALYFAFFTGASGLWLLQSGGGKLAALLGLAAIAYYVLVYTIWLKRLTTLNVVVGGAAGAAPPLIGWTAGAGELTLVPLLMFLVILLWTPPHFWALAIYFKSDYARVGVPMLPVIAGDKKTCSQMACYVLLLFPVTLWLGISAQLGWLYFIGSTFLGLFFVGKALGLRHCCSRQDAWDFFVYSNFYLAAIFLLILASTG